MSTQLPSFIEVEAAFATVQATASPAEAHGILCALFCGKARMQKTAWVDSLLTHFKETHDAPFNNARKILEQLFVATAESFAEEVFAIALLLPEDEAPLHVRMTALTAWCQGFLSGLQVIRLSRLEDPEVKEALADLMQMSCLEYEAHDEADQEAERAYTELVEYARMTVVLVYQR